MVWTTVLVVRGTVSVTAGNVFMILLTEIDVTVDVTVLLIRRVSTMVAVVVFVRMTVFVGPAAALTSVRHEKSKRLRKGKNSIFGAIGTRFD